MMPRENQNIRVNYWQKARNKKLSPEEKLVELFLITCPECGASGIFRMGTSAIAYEIGYSISKIDGILKPLELKGRVMRFEGDWVFVVGKFEYEPWKNEKVLKCVEKEIKIAPEPLYDCFLTIYNNLFPNLSYNTSDKLSHNYRVSVSVSDSVSVSAEEKPKRNVKIVSDKFYELFMSKNNGEKPGWGAKETKAVKELFGRYPDDTDCEIACVFEWIYNHRDKLWDEHLGSFISLSGRFFDRARTDMLKAKPRKPNNKPAYRCQGCGADYDKPMDFCYQCNGTDVKIQSKGKSDGGQGIPQTTPLAGS